MLQNYPEKESNAQTDIFGECHVNIFQEKNSNSKYDVTSCSHLFIALLKLESECFIPILLIMSLLTFQGEESVTLPTYCLQHKCALVNNT